MSASLVGSEMCIRDSRLGGARGSTPARTSRRGASTCGSGAGMTLSVSYTHLTLPTICSV
eukprot:10632598-Alexandrium_andersonii.AAC.1